MPKWQEQDVNFSIEKYITIGAIVNTQFLKELMTIYNPRWMKNTYSKIIIDCCIEHYLKFHKSPQRIIQNIVESKSQNDEIDETQTELISNFLALLSDEYEQASTFNVDYHITKAEEYFKERSIDHFTDDVNSKLVCKDIVGAEAAIANYKRVSRLTCGAINVLTDKDRIKAAFSSSRYLLQFPGAVGKLIGPIKIGDFIGIFGPAGRGKSWWL